ncbi:MAG: RsmG family class I SAM-dependent methyltransferase, partial [Pseudomonadota bacterium]
MIETEAQARAYVETWADPAALERIERFSALLLEENQRQNLISRPSEAHIWQRHIADSAQLLAHVPRETIADPDGSPWMDLGTGAGFPGIILAALLPGTPFILVESRARRAEFLESAVTALGLTQCKVIGERLERIKPFPVSVITARAFAPL